MKQRTGVECGIARQIGLYVLIILPTLPIFTSVNDTVSNLVTLLPILCFAVQSQGLEPRAGTNVEGDCAFWWHNYNVLLTFSHGNLKRLKGC